MPGPVITEVVADYDDELMPSKTYRLDPDTKRITGVIDGREAMRQAIYKILSTERASYPVYGTDEGINYGVELDRFIGKSFSFIASDIERTISDALLQDERVLSVNDFKVGDPTNDMLTLSFTVSTLYGDIEIGTEARIKK
ncbi:DUF2634 domain-containing protein [[Clostridium] innocuum]|nr:DUF2634 domain-containing protein [[Clostridium] innocuum]MCR0577070.1 DUF2634 domain-containing protein [[Clostridium] innocuum]